DPAPEDAVGDVEIADILAHVDVGRLDATRAGAGTAALHGEAVQVEAHAQVDRGGRALAAKIAANVHRVEVASHHDPTRSRTDQHVAANRQGREVAAHIELAAGADYHRAAHRQGSRLDGEEAVERKAQVADDRDQRQRLSADDELSPIKVHAGNSHDRRCRALIRALEGTVQVVGDHDAAARTKVD